MANGMQVLRRRTLPQTISHQIMQRGAELLSLNLWKECVEIRNCLGQRARDEWVSGDVETDACWGQEAQEEKCLQVRAEQLLHKVLIRVIERPKKSGEQLEKSMKHLRFAQRVPPKLFRSRCSLAVTCTLPNL